MRFSASFLCAALPVLSSVMLGVHASPFDIEGIECYPIQAVQKRDYDGSVEARSIKATTTAFINWLKANPAKLNRSPVFWTGKNGRKGAINAANLLKNNKAIVGPQGGFTVFDAVKEADANTKDWTANDDWAKACEAFAEHAQPESKKAFLVYGKEVDPVLNIWNNNEWPKLETNSHVTEVETYEMHDDGRGVTAKGEIKKSKKGNPIKSA